MARDPDYIDPAVLRARAAMKGGAGARSSRPRVRRTGSSESAGIRITGSREPVLSGVSFTPVGVKVSGGAVAVRQNELC